MSTASSVSILMHQIIKKYKKKHILRSNKHCDALELRLETAAKEKTYFPLTPFHEHS